MQYLMPHNFFLTKFLSLLEMLLVHCSNTKKMHQGYCVTCWTLTLLRIVVFCFEEKSSPFLLLMVVSDR